MNVKLDRALNKCENYLTEAAFDPILALPAGLFKISIGLIQTVIAISISIFLQPYSLVSKDWTLYNYSCSHIRHGIGNIGSGIIEAIPFIGTVSYEFRKTSKEINELPKIVSYVFSLNYWFASHSGYPEIDDNGLKTKFMVYDSLLDDDIKFIPFRRGIPRGDHKKVNELYQNKLNDPANKNITKLSLAEESLKECIAKWENDDEEQFRVIKTFEVEHKTS